VATNRRPGLVDISKRCAREGGLPGLLFYVFQVAEVAICLKRAVTASM